MTDATPLNNRDPRPAARCPLPAARCPLPAARGETGSNFVVFASTEPLRPAAGSLSGDDLRAFTGAAKILTDDYAPVDQLLTWD